MFAAIREDRFSSIASIFAGIGVVSTPTPSSNDIGITRTANCRNARATNRTQPRNAGCETRRRRSCCATDSGSRRHRLVPDPGPGILRDGQRGRRAGVAGSDGGGTPRKFRLPIGFGGLPRRAPALKANAALGRLNVSLVDGKNAAGAAYETIHAYGGRSFS